MEHTKGPWTTQWIRPNKAKGHTFEPTCAILANHPEYGTISLADIADPYDAEAEANARLIAAAPEMLSALKDIHKLWCCPAPKRLKDWSARCDIMADFARAAIAKAEGR